MQATLDTTTVAIVTLLRDIISRAQSRQSDAKLMISRPEGVWRVGVRGQLPHVESANLIDALQRLELESRLLV